MYIPKSGGIAEIDQIKYGIKEECSSTATEWLKQAKWKAENSCENLELGQFLGNSRTGWFPSSPWTPRNINFNFWTSWAGKHFFYSLALAFEPFVLEPGTLIFEFFNFCLDLCLSKRKSRRRLRDGALVIEMGVRWSVLLKTKAAFWWGLRFYCWRRSPFFGSPP